MRRFEEYLVEKLREPEFAEAFYAELETDLQNGAIDARIVASAFEDSVLHTGFVESSIARQIVMLRALHGLTQDNLASRAGTRQSSISRIESGETKPSVAFLERIAEALDADLEIRLVPRRSIN